MTYLLISTLVGAVGSAALAWLWRNAEAKSRAYRALATLAKEQAANQAKRHAEERAGLEGKIKNLENVIAGLDNRTNELVQIIVDTGGPGLAELGDRVLRNPYEIAGDSTAPRGMRVVATAAVDASNKGK